MNSKLEGLKNVKYITAGNPFYFAAKYHKTFTGKPFSEVDHMVNAQGFYLFCKYWKPEGDIKFLIGCIHGFGGHCVRFDELASRINSIGGFVYSHDHVGNGESEGPRTIVDDYHYMIDDINQHTEKMKKEYPGLPVFLYGQSMGGALATIAVSENPQLYKGFVSLGGMFVKERQLQYSVMRFSLQVVSYVAPNLQVTSFTEDNTTRDEEEHRKAENDPLRSCVIKVGMAFQLIRICERLDETMSSLESPFLALHGGDDVTCAVEGSRILYRTASSKDKKLKIYDGVLHDVIHELTAERERCFRDTLDWLKEHI